MPKEKDNFTQFCCTPDSRKYKCIKSISVEMELTRRVLRKSHSKCLYSKKEQRQGVSKNHAKRVIEFLSREDNCRIQPGKSGQ